MTALLQHTVRDQAERRPEATALVSDGERLSYGELEARSNRLARLLLERGCEPGDRVCLFVPKGIDAIVGMLAALKARCAYVPIDLASPAPRVRLVLDAAEPRLILATGVARSLLEDLTGANGASPIPVGTLDADGGDFAASEAESLSAEALDSGGRPEDIAHILFTSGSTGTPKGVMITHRNAVEFITWATRYFGTRESDRISGHPPLHFDLSTFDIYGSFLAGAELHLIPGSASLLPQKLAAVIRDAELTQWFAVPSIFTYMAKFDVIEQDDFPALERVLWCGEVLPTPILIHWMKRLPHATFTNLYGPTEATIASSYHTVREAPKSETEPIPIGVACDGEELLVLDDDRRPLPPGETGDLYIGGVGLSPGYWRDEEKTAAAFVPDPRGEGEERIYRTGDLARLGDDGLVYFLGRADSQIKHRGYRIELGEIETALNALREVRECAVVGVETDGFEGTAICAAYAASGDASVDGPVLSEALRKVLPPYMLPTRWLELEGLPKNVNGKIDRKRLKELFTENGS